MSARGNGIVRASIVAALVFGGVRPVGADPILFHQPATAPGGAASQQSPNTMFVAADDFVLDSGALITGVQWQGAFQSEPPSPITQFDVTFWSDADGLPGAPLQSYLIPGNAGQTLVGSFDFGGPSPVLEYDYAVTLPTPFLAQHGVRSWVSVQPTTTFAAQPQWFWRESESGGDGYSAIAGVGFSPTFERMPFDLAFTLTGTRAAEPPPRTVPEPSTLLLLGSGLGLLWRTRRRARRLAETGPTVD